ncbi:hypothetical protein NEPAR06_1962 [Nematocida parisii]|uniref:uncharacterized protein n=1 Tax=Nematocida parisii (strain ERTm1 / ATCC PRA-289) TaxID=881290 RepID=UPI000264B23B|nr:uncharacterized protein NEPG_02121 [Nematocida parisii ERTm1]KAI5130296.1 hypothetical protein NEPAR03_2048 [Nematocida parisii]EIJ93165.1 hypothetical protein NEPG_02121 [Nematocida parisii ERTm1]KAI5130493.1 hypothetical protein NEPAR08_2050 [Nematocida parisii]KAI5143908.1 hypothetical protein NEPAR04_1989 [Nematocida parisii]KAI5145851.1 hypothetical protein NEPAR07_1899 [Nematocida parisii]|eukprot:XP_013059948.1 hypothetical protein NEPG_02121 [Nematocida parisii ERTm1]
MDELSSLHILIEKAQWASFVYKQAGEAHAASLKKFTEAASHPRNREWRADALIISLLKHCDVQGMTLQSIHNISKIVSQDLDRAIIVAENHISNIRNSEKVQKEKIQAHIANVQRLVKKRKESSVSGKLDVWKADLELKKSILEYVRADSEGESLNKAEKHSTISVYNSLIKTYYKTLREYMTSAQGHLNILLNDVSEHGHQFVPPTLPTLDVAMEEGISLAKKEPCATKYNIKALTETERTKFNQIYAQALGGAPTTILTVRGCGLFMVPQLSSVHMMFIVCTSTNYFHAFSIQSIINQISNDLFVGNGSCPLTFLKKALLAFNEPEIEEINCYLLSNINVLPIIEKVFPISLKNKRVSLQANGKEMKISDNGFFSRSIKMQAHNPQQMRKFYALIKQETTDAVIDATHNSDETGEQNEIMASWSPATYDNPW